MKSEAGVAASNTIIFTGMALTGFAANSILSRMALGHHSIDAASFTFIRLLSGAMMLILISAFLRKKSSPGGGDWFASIMLFLYAITFSFAYTSLDTGSGALILFGSVQLTMILAALRLGEVPRPVDWIGLSLALGGLAYLVYPGLRAPSMSGSILMAISGVAWGCYSLRGRGSQNPLAETTVNFSRALPFALLVCLISIRDIEITGGGIMLATLSGAIASALGYVIWYAALRGLTATRAALVQLCVPLLAAAGGAVLLLEAVSNRLIIASIMTLGGIALALAGGKRISSQRSALRR